MCRMPNPEGIPVRIQMDSALPDRHYGNLRAIASDEYSTKEHVKMSSLSSWIAIRMNQFKVGNRECGLQAPIPVPSVFYLD